MNSDIKAIRVTGVGAPAIQAPARIRGLIVTTGAGVGRLTITDGDGGATLLDVDFAASTTDHVTIPESGIRATNSVYVSAATNITAATLLYS
jgi:hypothetical protein